MGTALAFATQALSALPLLIQSGVEIFGLINKTNERLTDMAANGRDPTAEEWDELNAEIDRLRGQLHNSGLPGDAP